MIKQTYNSGFKFKFYPSLDEGFYLMILRDLDRLKIKVLKGGLKKE